MTRPWRSTRGLTLVELMVASTIGLLTMAAFTAMLATLLGARGRATETTETTLAAASAIDQIVRDVRLAGYDPTARGIVAIAGASATTVVLGADLDGDGRVDPTSEELITYRTSNGGDTLERVVGQQSLPLLADLAPGGFRLGYLDADGAELDPRAPDTSAATRALTVELALRATATHAALRMRGAGRLLNR